MAGTTPGVGDEDIPEPPRLRRLRRLVTVLTATLIIGVITVVGLLVIRLWSFDPTPPPALPAAVALPAGESARAVTMGTGWIAVVTVDGGGRERIRMIDATTGTGIWEIEIALDTKND